MNRLSAVIVVLLACGIAAFAQEAKPRRGFAYPPVMEGATVETYKKASETELKLWIFQPDGKPAAGAGRAAMVFFFGGGWTSGSPAQFERQCRYLAGRGMVAIAADYRVASRQQVKAAACVADAKSCLRWVRRNAARLGIDPERVAAGGGSAGGHLAAATATLPGLDEPGEDATHRAAPDALVLFNPALVMAPYPGLQVRSAAPNADRLGCEPEAISPIHHVRANLPPTLILHGRADRVVPYVTVEAFAAAMKKAGNRCELVGYDGQPHGFFNGARFEETVAEMERFLGALGYLAGGKSVSQ